MGLGLNYEALLHTHNISLWLNENFNLGLTCQNHALYISKSSNLRKTLRFMKSIT